MAIQFGLHYCCTGVQSWLAGVCIKYSNLPLPSVLETAHSVGKHETSQTRKTSVLSSLQSKTKDRKLTLTPKCVNCPQVGSHIWAQQELCNEAVYIFLLLAECCYKTFDISFIYDDLYITIINMKPEGACVETLSMADEVKHFSQL